MLRDVLSRYAAVVLACLGWAAAQNAGGIQGIVEDTNGRGLASIAVRLWKGDTVLGTQTTDDGGKFVFRGVSAGKYTLSFDTANGNHYRMDVDVAPGASISVDQEIPVDVGVLASATVYAASRETESLINAPAPISTVDPAVKTLYAGAGQVPGMLGGVPGAELTQSGLYDYNLNVRGFNALLNRRMAVRIDGRDPSVPFLGNQEWSSLAFLEDDLETMEVLRGPSAALYGQNAFNGVVDLTTKSPRESLGGDLRFTAGELHTYKVDGRWAARISPTWFFDMAGGYTGSRDFSRSRNVSVEYPGLPMEVIPLPTRHVDLASGLVRFDKYFADDKILTLEAGAQSLAGPVFVIGVGRAQSDAIRTWTRSHFAAPGWDLLFYDNTRDSPNEPALGSGVPIWEKDRNYQGEVQAHRRPGRRTDVLAGGNYRYETVTTANNQGVQTLLSRPVSANRGSVYGQIRQPVAVQARQERQALNKAHDASHCVSC